VKKIFSILLVFTLVAIGTVGATGMSVSAEDLTSNYSNINSLLNDPLVISIAEKSDSLESLKINYDALSPSDQDSLTKSMSVLYALIASDKDPDAFYATLPQKIQNLITMDLEGRSATVEYNQITGTKDTISSKGIVTCDGYYTMLVKTFLGAHAYEIRFGITWYYNDVTCTVVDQSAFFHPIAKLSGSWTVDSSLERDYNYAPNFSNVNCVAMAHTHFLRQHDYPWAYLRGSSYSETISYGIAGGNTWEWLFQELWDELF
jgi:hypothetical protein